MAEFNIEDLDKNLEVAAKVKAPDLVLYDVRKPPFQIYGLYQPTTEPCFKRMPTEVAVTVSKGAIIIPAKPQSLKPTYSAISVKRGSKPRCRPRSFGSRADRVRLMTAYRPSRPTARPPSV